MHSAAQVSLDKITWEKCGREVFSRTRGAHQLKVAIIPEYRHDSEMAKLSNIALLHDIFPKLQVPSRMMAALTVVLKQRASSFLHRFSLHQGPCGSIHGKWHTALV